MDDTTPTSVGPEPIEQLRLADPDRARRLLQALRSDDPVPCICGRADCAVDADDEDAD